MTGRNSELLEILKKEVVPAVGCTEPVAVAYSVAFAKKQVSGELQSIEITVDPGLYKNGLRVGIPGIAERGLHFAAALGYVIGSPEKKLEILNDISPLSIKKAHEIIQQGKVNVKIKKGFDRLYIETILTTTEDRVRVITLDRHLNIVNVDKSEAEKDFETEYMSLNLVPKAIQKYHLSDFIKFADEVSIDELAFLKDGLKMNLEMAQAGLDNTSTGKNLLKLIEKGLISDDMISRAQFLCSTASEARMAGIRKPVMSSAGSGNHGITVFLTNAAVAEKRNIPEEKLLRALALSNLVTAYIKSYTGTLSAMCGCGVAAGIGASAGVAYMLGGTEEQILGAMINMVGSISGIVCDGGKEGCAYKLALSSGWAIEAALLALSGSVVNTEDGILASDFKKLFQNLGYICNPGMVATNDAILEIMMESH